MSLPPVADDVQSAIEEAAAVISAAGRLVVACHIGPDGDALGSMLAIGLACSSGGAQVQCSWGAASVDLPDQYAFIPGADLLVPPAQVGDADLFVAVDCASEDRLDKLVETSRRAVTRVNIDHHVSNTNFGTLNVVDAASPSSSEVVLRILEAAGMTITPDIATCLYVGLLTDTGSFQYSSVTPRAHAAAGRLIELGVAVDRVSQAVYESLPFGYLKTLGRVLERCQLQDEWIVTYLTQADLDETGIGMDETEGLIDVVRSIRESDVAAIFKELTDGRWKVSLRSKGDTDVGVIARGFGGGGHRLAAGFELKLDRESSMRAVREALAGQRARA